MSLVFTELEKLVLSNLIARQISERYLFWNLVDPLPHLMTIIDIFRKVRSVSDACPSLDEMWTVTVLLDDMCAECR